MMNRTELKSILRQQSELLDQAIEEKLKILTSDDDFSSDVFEQVEPQYINDEFEKAFGISPKEGKILQELPDFDDIPLISEDEGLDIIYSHRSEELSKELPENRVVSYQRKIAALRGISMVDDFAKAQK